MMFKLQYCPPFPCTLRPSTGPDVDMSLFRFGMVGECDMAWWLEWSRRPEGPRLFPPHRILHSLFLSRGPIQVSGPFRRALSRAIGRVPLGRISSRVEACIAELRWWRLLLHSHAQWAWRPGNPLLRREASLVLFEMASSERNGCGHHAQVSIRPCRRCRSHLHLLCRGVAIHRAWLDSAISTPATPNVPASIVHLLLRSALPSAAADLRSKLILGHEVTIGHLSFFP